MSDLMDVLENTIRDLETIRDADPGVNSLLLEQIDELYDQEQRLIEASVSAATPGYKTATVAMKKAAEKAKQAAQDLSKVDDLIDNLASAIELIEGVIG